MRRRVAGLVAVLVLVLVVVARWRFACPACDGTGAYQGQRCEVCEGWGL